VIFFFSQGVLLPEQSGATRYWSALCDRPDAGLTDSDRPSTQARQVYQTRTQSTEHVRRIGTRSGVAAPGAGNRKTPRSGNI